MSDESSGGGVKRIHSPEPVPEAVKALRIGVTPPTQHISVVTATDFCTETPVSSKTESSLVQKCRRAGITVSGGKADIDTVHELLIEVAIRVSALEGQISEKDEEIFTLRRENANLEQKISNATTEFSSMSMRISPNESFLDTMKNEFPLLSDGLAKAEETITKLQTDIAELSTDIQTLHSDDGAALVDETATGSDTQGSQPGNLTLAAINLEKQKMMEEMNNINNRAKQRRRMAHLEGDQRDQYSRRDILRVTGVPYKQGENTNHIIMMIAYSLGVTITEWDISVSHRTGRRGGRGPRPILCKFTRRDIKNQILTNKRLARFIKNDPDGNPVQIYVDEDLTRMRASICKRLRQERVPHYTRDGKVHISTTPSSQSGADIEYTMFDTPEDFLKLQWPESVLTEIGVYPRD